MNHTIISSGSVGNCVVIGKIMVDIGVPFKKVKDHLYDVDCILLTHIHSDHIKESTLKNICMMFPHIKIYGNYEVVQSFDEYPIQVVNENLTFIDNDIAITPFRCIHDVVCYGYTWEFEGKSIIYGTDTSTMEFAPKKQYDYFFIESNHDETKLVQIENQRAKFGYNVFAGAKRHLSTQKAKGFYYTNRRDSDAKLIELHKSNRFY